MLERRFVCELTASPALCRFRKQLKDLEDAHMLRGTLSAAQQLGLLSSYDDLAQALEGAFFVQVKLAYDTKLTSSHKLYVYQIHR